MVAGTGCTAGEALLGSVPVQFSNITTYSGLPSGNTTFVAGTPNASVFNAFGTTNNVIDFSAASSGVTVNLTAGPTARSGSDTISNLTTVIGSIKGNNTFEAGSAPSYTFTSDGNGNTFDGGAGTDIFSGSGSKNTFNVGHRPRNTVRYRNRQRHLLQRRFHRQHDGAERQRVGYAGDGLIQRRCLGRLGDVQLLSSGNAFTSFIGAANGYTDFLAPAGGRL